ncbi:hypothetical protein HMPREF2738_02093 [Clostridiales bacterium KLE1615]|nr:hypothetical protein HMPREF2738_02093 [Clostridiales bacterium KLE1615]
MRWYNLAQRANTTRQQLQRQLLLVSMKGWVTNCHYQNRAGFAISVLLRI